MDCEFKEVFSFIYKADVGKGLVEHEFDHVFIGVSDEEPIPNADEVCDWKYVDLEILENDVKESPDNYTVWFKIALSEVLEYFGKRKV